MKEAISLQISMAHLMDKSEEKNFDHPPSSETSHVGSTSRIVSLLDLMLRFSRLVKWNLMLPEEGVLLEEHVSIYTLLVPSSVKLLSLSDYLVVIKVKHTKVEEEREDYGSGGNDCELDQLLLVHSDIASVLHQIDELVGQAMKRKTMSKQGTREVESFRSFLSDMLSTLKTLV